AHVLRILLVVEQNAWWHRRLGGLYLHAAPAFRPHGADVRLVAVATLHVAAVVGHGNRQEVILQIGMLDAGLRTDEAAGLEVAAGAETGLEHQPLQADSGLLRP